MNRPHFLFRPNMQNEDHRRAWQLLQDVPEGQKSAFIVRAILRMDQAEGLETLLRILSMVGGGVICFVISAIYSYSVKRLSISAKDARETEGDPEEPSTE